MAGMAIMLAAVCLNVVCNDLNNSTEITTASPTISGLEIINEIQTKDTRLNELINKISGTTLKVVTLNDYPLSYVTKVNGKLRGAGVAFKIFEFLTDKFNFTYEIVNTTANVIGSSSEMEGSILESLNQTEADIAVAFLPLLADTRKHITYSTTALDEGEWIMIMTRPPASATGSGLTAPFTYQVWLLILVSLLAVGPLIYGLIILRYKLTKDSSQKTYPLPHCVWFVYGALMKQGSTLTPVADSTRMLFATWWIFITILTSFYTANLTAFLTLSKFTLPINTAEDILRKDKHFVSRRGGCVEYAIRNENEALHGMSKMFNTTRAQLTTNSDDRENLISYVQDKDFVFVRDRPAMDHLIYKDYRIRRKLSATDEKMHCPFATSKQPFIKRKRAFAYPQNTIWNTLFDPELLHLVESGIVKYMLLQGLPNAEICPQTLGGTERQLRNADLLMTYYIMFAGFCTALVVFITEVMFRYLNGHLNYRDGNLRFAFTNKTKKNTELNSNVTPPPAYASLFTRSRNKIWTTDKLSKTPDSAGVKQIINGRDYMVFKNEDGESRLIPLRTPSAALFQYAYTK